MKEDIIVFGTHPDDVELCCSGTLIKLAKKDYKIVVVDLTRGEKGTRGTVQEREKESKTALDIMGLDFRENLKIPDTSIETNEDNRNKVINVIRKYRAEVIFLPHWDDIHPDHAAASKLIADASFYSGLEKIKTDYKPFKPLYNLFYIGRRKDIDATFVVDITDEYALKMKAIRAYNSQFPDDKNKDLKEKLDSPFSIENLEARDRFYGSIVGVEFGEPFLIKNSFKTSDPIKVLFS